MISCSCNNFLLHDTAQKIKIYIFQMEKVKVDFLSMQNASVVEIWC